MSMTPSGGRIAVAAALLLLGVAAAVIGLSSYGAGTGHAAPPAAVAAADQPGHGHGAHGQQQPGGGQGAADADAGAVVRAFQEANARMHAAMSEPGTGDADRDFARGMIAHHEGAIDMAEILLRYGSDPDLRALAEDVIEVQRREIEFLQRWLAEHPG